MRSYRVAPGAGIAGLRIHEHPIPEPRPTEVLVRVHATSLNYRELNVLRGNYPLPLKSDLIPVSDGAGEVTAVGDEVTRVSVGERVAAAIFPRWQAGAFTMDVADQLGGSRDGMLTEYAVLPDDALVRVPDHLSYAEAATLPCAAVTAWHALTGGRGLRPGDTVLTLGSGGVSLFALKFAQLFGARVIATTGNDDKVTLLSDLGAAHVFNYRRTPAWSEQVREVTDGAGADLVVEVAGGLEHSLAAVARGGEIAFVGMLDNQEAVVEQRALWLSGAAVRPVAVGSRAHITEMVRAIGAHQVRPVIDRVFPFSDAPAAYRYFETGRPFGKVVIAHA
jgi:NADPH:quinone reductase-like Zn-dependent oxidoreductase